MLVLGLAAYLAARQNVRSHSAGESDRPQQQAPTCVALRSHPTPPGPRRPAGRHHRTGYISPRR
nr:hypothetical protein [Kibdelosporangium sp. MJ126-NF4]CTQ97648.1 hypothetical protein [Kibdelosporangium sp. MJ126-NF4]